MSDWAHCMVVRDASGWYRSMPTTYQIVEGETIILECHQNEDLDYSKACEAAGKLNDVAAVMES